LEEIDLIFSKPARQLVRENLKNTTETLGALLHGRFNEVFPPASETHATVRTGSGSRAVKV